MILAIEAVNIRSGGGLKHLKGMLEHFINSKVDFENIVVYTSRTTMLKLPTNHNIKYITNKIYEKTFLLNLFYQLFYLKKSLIQNKCDIVFVPGSIFLTNYKSILMPQNLLPYEPTEIRRFKYYSRIKFHLIRYLQVFSMKKSTGVIYLSNYAHKVIKKYVGEKKFQIIQHGVERVESPVKKGSSELNFLYVSPFLPYKHQHNVLLAFDQIATYNKEIRLTLVGQQTQKKLPRLKNKCQINIVGNVPSSEVDRYYKEADIFIFASTCENFPITVIEAMSYSLPILISNYGVMPEVLKTIPNFYLDPTNIHSICNAIKFAINNPDELEKQAKSNFKISQGFSLDKCYNEAFNFLNKNIT